MATETLTKDSCTLREHSVITEDAKHTLYVQEWGAKDGIPVLFLHGGPGQGCHDGHKAIFNPATHRVIFVDQRGCGNSTPAGSLEENTTQNLVADLELVRQKLGITKWHITGGSWGSTLALCYAIAHPSSINSMIIRGIFTATKFETDWLEEGGYRHFFPEVAERYEQEKGDSNEISAAAYTNAVIDIIRLDDRPASGKVENYDYGPVVTELHYMKHAFFLEENYILEHAAELTMPIAIIQGRYDMLCPPVAAYNLHKLLPNSTLHWTVAGHSGSDRGNYDTVKALLARL